MIISELKGRLGNAMFFICCGKYIANKINTKFYVTLANNNCDKNYYYNEIFNKEFFNQIDIIDSKDINMLEFKNIDNNYSHLKDKYDLPLKDNLYISGWFVFNNVFVDKETAINTFKPSKLLVEEIKDLYNPTYNDLALNIRRGDFLNENVKKLGYNTLSIEYYKKAIEILSKDKKYNKIFIISDDLSWCKDNFTFLDNFIIVDKKSSISNIYSDLFIQTFCGDNIISPSTFSWWGQYLNQNNNKKVIMPYPWNLNLNDKKNIFYYTNNCIKLNINTLEIVK